VVKHRANPKFSLSDAEYQLFAEQFVDLLVDRRQDWLLQYIMAGGLDHIPTEEEIKSGEFALQVIHHLKRGETQLIEVSLYEALTTGDREMLVPYTKQWALGANFSREDMRLLLNAGTSSSLQRSFSRLKSTFNFRVGGRIKLAPGHGERILQRAEQLRPAIAKVLGELASHTSHTLPEILQYCQTDYPEACKFLSLHVQRFEQAFNDKRVINRATKRISARARALADAMAGTEYELAFSTSIEKVREARRIARRQKPSSNSPQISD
jgi:hypothetical protein